MSSLQQENICHMFDRIARSYDSVNRILSFRQDVRWRKIVAEMIPKEKPIKVLDLATGTADLLLDFCQRRPNISEGYGVDLSDKMLAFGQKKVNASPFSQKINLSRQDAAQLSFEDSSFDVVSISFGIRNVVEKERALKEIFRVLKPDGLALILEFSLPKNSFIRFFYLTYFRYILPLVGGLISRDLKAYQYLNHTVEQFPYADAFCKLMKDAGFLTTEQTLLTFGVATIYAGRKI